MTLRVVRLRDVDGTLHIIPNGQITTVSNQTRGWSRAVVDVTVAYESDLDRALGVFREEARPVRRRPAWSRLLDGPPEVLGVQQLAERGVTIRTLLRTHPGKQWEVARGFRFRILERLGRKRIAIAALPSVSAHCGGGAHPGRRQSPSSPGASHDAAALQHADAQRSSRSRRSTPPRVASTPAARRSGLRAHRELPDLPLRGPAAAVARGERVRGVPGHEPHRRGRPHHRRGAPRPGTDIDAAHGAVHRGVPRGPRVPPHPAGARAPARDRATCRAMVALVEAAAGEGRRVQGRGRLGLLLDRALSRRTAGCRSSTSASSAPGRAAAVASDEYAKDDARDFALWKAAQPRGRDGRRGVGRAVRPRPPRLAPRVLGDGARPVGENSASTCSTSTPAAWT